jgi:hypothetical protein
MSSFIGCLTLTKKGGKKHPFLLEYLGLFNGNILEFQQELKARSPPDRGYPADISAD